MTPLRAVSSAIVVQSGNAALANTLALHLCVGDSWNTINNVERRLGFSSVFVPLVWASAWRAIFVYSSTPAGWLLAPLGVWLTVASCLVVQTWRINVDGSGKRDTLYPSKTAVTLFRWEK